MLHIPIEEIDVEDPVSDPVTDAVDEEFELDEEYEEYEDDSVCIIFNICYTHE